MSKRLVELAEVRHIEVDIAGEKITVREPSALQMIEHRAIRRTDAGKALAYLIHECCVDIEGKPLWTEDEALVLANGRQEVALPLINAITGWIASEKKASPPKSVSGTA
jgi:hypothetical protein